jgi:hypothetical protein
MKLIQNSPLLGCLILLAGTTVAAQDEGPRFSLSAGAEYTTGLQPAVVSPDSSVP